MNPKLHGKSRVTYAVAKFERFKKNVNLTRFDLEKIS